MNVPLSWLAEYVTLPKSEKELTDKLTMVGHMLDKRKEVSGDVVIDLELRGNRADMFGIIGVARDVSAMFHTPLKLPKIAKLPKVDPKSSLIKADPSVDTLIKRFMAIKLEVTVGPSPKWLADRLLAYGIDPINNVVDVTNYVMVETSHPMHAFDLDKLVGHGLTLRRAKQGEKFETIQQGTTLTLSKEDIAIADGKSVQSITCIGGLRTKVTDITTSIILETAVYDPVSCRRTARRHKVSTEGGGRHEKHQDPHELPFVLARALYILQDIAQAKIIGSVSEYYPHPTKPTTIDFDYREINRLGGMEIAQPTTVGILKDLGFSVTQQKSKLSLEVPTFRTDIDESADVVEEILRIHGYEKIPTKTLSGVLPEPDTAAMVSLSESIRDHLVQMQVNEVITASIIANELVPLYEQTGAFDTSIRLINAPDPDIATLRPSLLPNLVSYAKRSLGFRQRRMAFFEIGKSYRQEKKLYGEKNMLGILMTGDTANTSWNKTTRPITVYDVKGVVEGLLNFLGISYAVTIASSHPSLYPEEQATITINGTVVGAIGMLHHTIQKEQGIAVPLYAAELSLDALLTAPHGTHQPYTIASLYPPIIEDLSFTLEQSLPFGNFLVEAKAINPLIESVILLDAYANKRTVRVTYASPTRTLTSDDTKPIRQKLIDLAADQFHAILKTTS